MRHLHLTEPSSTTLTGRDSDASETGKVGDRALLTVTAASEHRQRAPRQPTSWAALDHWCRRATAALDRCCRWVPNSTTALDRSCRWAPRPMRSVGPLLSL